MLTPIEAWQWVQVGFCAGAGATVAYAIGWVIVHVVASIAEYS